MSVGWIDCQKDEKMRYKGYEIQFNTYGTCEYCVHYCGDDVLFREPMEAIEFIDEITAEDEKKK